MRELQYWLQDVITAKGDLQNNLYQAKLQHNIDETDVIADTGTVSTYTRLNVYATGYFMRLYECLAADFPVLKKFLRDDVFFAFAKAFLQTIPSTSYTLHDLGKEFVLYLENTRPVTDDPSLNSMINLPVELARLERIRQEVVRSKGNENKLTNTPQSFESLFFNANTLLISSPESLRLAEFGFPMKRFIHDVNADNYLHHLPEPSHTFMAISRKNYHLTMEEITDWQYTFLQQCSEKLTMQQVINNTSKLTGRPVGKIMADLYILLPSLLNNNFITVEEY